jgi:hypothetical protein
MNALGQFDPAEREHELAELGPAATTPGPLKALSEAKDLATIQKLYESTLADLATKVAAMKPEDPKLAYHRTLMVLTKKVELELRAQVDGLARLSREIEEMHDFVHEMYPVE